MFLSGIKSKIRGHTSGEVLMKFSPDGKELADVRLGVGGGNDKYPVMWVTVTVWEAVAEEAVAVLDRKGIRIEAEGWLYVRKYVGKKGTTEVDISLRDVRELTVYDREGDVERVIRGEAQGENKGVERAWLSR